MDEAEQPAVEPGEVLAGKYEIVREIGRGGMAVVYEGIHRRLGKRVAIKILRGEATKEPELVRRFEREAMASAQLQSSHVARVTDVESMDDGTAFMVMEYLEGRDLDEELQRRGQLDVEEAVDHVIQASMAMVEAHELGIVHRDLKPQNLFLTDDGGQSCIKVLDFGISKFQQRGDSTVTQTTSSFGTPLYMSPEQIRSTKHVDGRTDVWSLGVILYELLAGRPPFNGSTPTAVIAAISADKPVALDLRRPVVSHQLAQVVARALAKEADERYGDVKEFALALAPFASAKRRAELTRVGVKVVPDARVSAASTNPARPGVVDEPTAPAYPDTQGAWAAADTNATTRFERAKPWLAGLGVVAVLAAVLFLVVGGGDEDAARVGAGVDAAPEPPGEPTMTTELSAAPVPSAGASEEPVTAAPSASSTASASATAAARPPRRPPPRPPATTPPRPPPRPAPTNPTYL